MKNVIYCFYYFCVLCMNFSDPDRGLSRAGSVMSAAMLDSESAFIGTCFTS